MKYVQFLSKFVLMGLYYFIFQVHNNKVQGPHVTRGPKIALVWTMV